MGDHLDAAWVREQLVPDMTWTNASTTLIADGHSNFVFIFDKRGPQTDVAPDRSAELKALVSRALRAPTNSPVSKTAFISMGGQLYLAAVQRIVPNDARANGPLAKHFALAYLAPLDRSVLNGLQRSFHIAPIAIMPTPQPGQARIALTDGHGKAIAYLNWLAAEPGRAFANEVAPFALMGFVLMGALQLVILRSWLRAAQRMRDVGIARTMFLANVSHELRTPLNAIIGFSECMSTEMFGPLDEQYREYANDILMSGRHLLGIVDDVLDLTQLNSSDTIALEPVTLSEAVSRPLRMLHEYAKNDAIKIDLTDHSEGSTVLANQKAVSQLLLNLGSNAVKFSPHGARVEIVLQKSSRPNFVEVLVRDRGTGIPSDKLRLIGQPFLQAHNGTARKAGSGLGLAIVKSLSERLGGEFVVQSVPGAGTTAIVRLPVYCAAPAPQLDTTRDPVSAGSSAF